MRCLCYVSLCAELEGLVEPTPAADWWSLGAILFEILTGKVMGLYWAIGLISLVNYPPPFSFSPRR